MDDKQFDTLSRTLPETHTRRGLLGVLAVLAAAIGCVVLADGEGAARRKGHNRHAKN